MIETQADKIADNERRTDRDYRAEHRHSPTERQHIHDALQHDHDGHIHNHNGQHSHGKHSHTHTQTKAVLNRLSKAAGHLEAVRKMVEQGRDCSEVLIQLSAVISALHRAGKVILKDHLEHCIIEAVEQNDQETIDKLNQAIDSFL